MLIFISGSINAGKTTTSKLLAQKLNAHFINVDDLNDTIPNFNLSTDLDRSMDGAIQTINNYLEQGHTVVANYVLRLQDYKRLMSEVKSESIHVFTLAPSLEVAQSQRGQRVLTNWEVKRIKHHYDTGIADPTFGTIIDNSSLSMNAVVNKILELIARDT